MLGDVYKLFVFKSLPSHLKQTFPSKIWILNFKGDGIEPRLPFLKYFLLYFEIKCFWKLNLHKIQKKLVDYIKKEDFLKKSEKNKGLNINQWKAPKTAKNSENSQKREDFESCASITLDSLLPEWWLHRQEILLSSPVAC